MSIAFFIAALAAAGQPAPAAPSAAGPAPTQAQQIAQFEQSLRQRGFSDAAIRAIVSAAPQGAAQAQALQGQADAAIAELRTAAAATPIDVARVTALLRRLDDLNGQMARLGTDATVRNLQLFAEPDRRLLLETMGLRGNPQAPPAAAAPH